MEPEVSFQSSQETDNGTYPEHVTFICMSSVGLHGVVISPLGTEDNFYVG